MKGSWLAKWIRDSMGAERRSWELTSLFLWSQESKAEEGQGFTLHSTELKHALCRPRDRCPFPAPCSAAEDLMGRGFRFLQELESGSSVPHRWVSAEREGRECQDGQEAGVGVGASPFLCPPGASGSLRSLPSEHFPLAQTHRPVLKTPPCFVYI